MDIGVLERISRISDNKHSVMSMSAGALSDSAIPFDNMPLRRRDYIWNVIGSRQMVSTHMHTRFTDIPVHSHSYLEMMYICAGTVCHQIEGYPSLLLLGSPDKGEEDTLRRRIGDYLETSYRTATLTELSELIGLTPPYVSRQIVELFGTSFSELVKEKRFAEAERMLLHSDLSVSSIAEAIGYENNSFFHRRFREQYGTSPAKWRKRDR